MVLGSRNQRYDRQYEPLYVFWRCVEIRFVSIRKGRWKMMENHSVIQEVRLDRMQFGDTYLPWLAIRYNNIPIAGEDPTIQFKRATITIAPTGGGSSKLRVTITIYKTTETGASYASAT